MWPSLLISLIAFERQAALSAPSPVITVSGCELNLHLQILVPWPRATWCPCKPFTASTMMQKKIIWNTIAQSQVSAQTHFHPAAHPPGPIECLILADVVCKWKGGHHPQHAPSLDPCQPHTSALICSSFWAAGTGGSCIKRLIPIDPSTALSLALHLMVDGAPDWNRAVKTRRGRKQPDWRRRFDTS